MRMIIALMLALLVACGGSGQPSEEETGAEGESPHEDVELAIVDTIGVELGDSNLVLGSPAASCCMPEGRVAILDIDKNSVGVYSRDGSFIGSVGREGSGPGEFNMPGGMTVTPSGGLVVSDFGARKLIRFDPELDYCGELTGFFPSPPQDVVFLGDSSFVGRAVAYETGGETMEAGFMVGRWKAGPVEPEVVYLRELSPFDPQDMFGSQATEMLFTASSDGTVYTCAKSTEEYFFQAWNPDGSELFRVSEPFEREPKTPAEMQLERDYVRGMFTSRGAPEEMVESFEPDPYRVAISHLGIAPDGNLWVRMGARRHPVFRVYDPHDGTYLYSASLDSAAHEGELEVSMNRWGFTARDPMSDMWPRVYVLEYADSPGAPGTGMAD